LIVLGYNDALLAAADTKHHQQAVTASCYQLGTVVSNRLMGSAVDIQLQGSVAHSQVDIERSQCTELVLQDKPFVL